MMTITDVFSEDFCARCNVNKIRTEDFCKAGKKTYIAKQKIKNKIV